MRINEAEVLKSQEHPDSKILDALVGLLEEHDTLCRKCIKSHKMLCSGTRPFVVSDSPLPRTTTASCHRVSEESQLVSRLIASHLPDDEITRIMSEVKLPKVKFEEGSIKINSRILPWVAINEYPVDDFSLSKYFDVMAGMLEKDYSTLFIYPAAIVQGTRKQAKDVSEWEEYFSETDFLIAYCPEEVVPMSNKYRSLIQLITSRIGAKRPTWVLCNSIDLFERLGSNREHPLHGLYLATKGLERINLK